MLLQELREQVAEYGRRMLQEGMTRGTGGYICARDPETGLVCSSPSSMDYMKIRPEDVIVSDVDGNILEGTGTVSSEWNVIRDVLKNRSDIMALVHTHSRFATTISALRMDLPAASFTLPQCGGKEVRCTGYHSFYSQALSDDINEKMKDRMAVLMGNHGLLAASINLKNAYYLATEIEFSAEVYWRAKCIGEPYVLSQEECDEYMNDYHRYTHIYDKKRKNKE